MTKLEFTQFKKEIRKEIPEFQTHDFYMTKKQEALHTATICVASKISYEREIEYYKEHISSYQGCKYDAYYYINKFQSKLEKYGTPYNYALAMMKEMINSQAFKKLNDVRVEVVEQSNCYYIRLYY